MVPIDYSTLQARTRARLNAGTDDPWVVNVDEYVNEALHLLEASAPDGWPWMRKTLTLTTTASTQTYSFTVIGALDTPDVTVSKVLGARVLRSTVYVPLRLMSQEEAWQCYPSTTTGVPEAWYAEGQTFYLYPSPDAVYDIPIRVVTVETDLGGATSTPMLPVVFHSAIVDAAAMLAYTQVQDDLHVQAMQANVVGWVERMKRYGREYVGAPKIKVRDWLA